jgi:WD40 repeat protein
VRCLSLVLAVLMVQSASAQNAVLYTGGVHFLLFSPDGKTLVVARDDGELQLWDVARQKKRATIKDKDETRAPSTGVFLPDGKTLAIGNHTGTIALWDLSTASRRARFKAHDNSVDALWVSGDGKILASGSGRGHSVNYWDAESGKERSPRRSLQGYRDTAFTTEGVVAIAPDGKSLALAGSDNGVRLWNLATGKPKATVWPLIGEENRELAAPQVIAYSPDGRLVVCGHRKRFTIWEVASGQECGVLEGHNQWVTAVAYTGNSRTLITGSYDKTVKLWDIVTRKESTTLKGHADAITAVAVSPDGKTAASGAWKDAIRFWDVSEWTQAQTSAAKISEKDLQEVWMELASDDANKAHLAIGRLVGAAKQTIPFLQKSLPSDPLLTGRITRWVADLENEDFDIREQTTKELENVRDLAGPALRKALLENRSPEVRSRAERLLDRLQTPEAALRRLQNVRAVSVLEYIGSAEAQKVLEQLAQGVPDAEVTQDAKASLQRLKGRERKP